MAMDVTLLHLGALHPWEQAITVVLAFGPFVVLGVVVAVRRRRDEAEQRAAAEAAEAAAGAAGDRQRDR